MPNHRIPPVVGLNAVLGLGVLLAACDAEWGGAELTLERPPTPEDTATASAAPEDTLPALPRPPMLYRVESEADGRARIVPVALIRDGGLESIDLPEEVPDRWWQRFDSTFLAPGRELPVRGGGGRMGTVILTEPVEPSGPRCPGVSRGLLLLPPETSAPASAFALSPGAGPPGVPLARRDLESTGRQRTFAPILAERLLREAGVERHYLARGVDRQPVALGDSVPGFAATFLVADSLAVGAPTGSAVSLFYLARFHPSEGFVVDWFVVRRYETAGDKAAYRHLESLHLPGGRIDLLRRYGGTGVGLVAAWEAAGDRRIRWSESEECPAGESLRRPN